MSLVSVRARLDGPRALCPFCREQTDERVKPCACGVSYHPECRAALSRCATLGCTATRVGVERATLPDRPWRSVRVSPPRPFAASSGPGLVRDVLEIVGTVLFIVLCVGLIFATVYFGALYNAGNVVMGIGVVAWASAKVLERRQARTRAGR